MPFPTSKKYGVLKARVTQVEGEFTSHKSGMSHYNLICNDSVSGLDYQINIDIQSEVSANVKMLILKDFDTKTQLPSAFETITPGFTPLPCQPGGLALDLIHQPIFTVNQLKDSHPQNAAKIAAGLNEFIQVGTQLVVFGTYYDDSDHQYHQQFITEDESYRDHHMYGVRRHREQQRPSRGVDDVHLNQGTPSIQFQSKDNGVYQDGALFIRNPDGDYTACFFAFAGQCFDTNQQGNCDAKSSLKQSSTMGDTEIKGQV